MGSFLAGARRRIVVVVAALGRGAGLREGIGWSRE